MVKRKDLLFGYKTLYVAKYCGVLYTQYPLVNATKAKKRRQRERRQKNSKWHKIKSGEQQFNTQNKDTSRMDALNTRPIHERPPRDAADVINLLFDSIKEQFPTTS